VMLLFGGLMLGFAAGSKKAAAAAPPPDPSQRPRAH